MPSDAHTITRLIGQAREGDKAALNELFGAAYDELLRLAHKNRYGWQGDNTLNTTALVHVAYEKLADQSEVDWNSRAHFFSVAARAMRQVLIDYARGRRAEKRGGDVPKVSLEEMREA